MAYAATVPPRALIINGVFFAVLGAGTAVAAMAIDGQPLGFAFQLAAVAILGISIAAAFIPFARPAARFRRTVLLLTIALLLFLPLLVPGSASRFIVSLWAIVLVMKLFDLYYGSRYRAVDERLAFPFLFTSHLVLRNARLTPRRAEPVARRLLESAVGGALLIMAMFMDWRAWPFLLEHSVKFLLIAAAMFPGMNAVMSLIRLAGGSASDFSSSAVRSRTPAEFWQRYNRIVGEFLHYDIGRSLGGVHAPVIAVVAAFVFSAALHEYLFAVAVGRVIGYQTAFFALNALAVLATMRRAPRGLAGAAGNVLTLVFLLLTTTLFGANMHSAIPIYSNPLPAWLAW